MWPNTNNATSHGLEILGVPTESGAGSPMALLHDGVLRCAAFDHADGHVGPWAVTRKPFAQSRIFCGLGSPVSDGFACQLKRSVTAALDFAPSV